MSQLKEEFFEVLLEFWNKKQSSQSSTSLATTDVDLCSYLFSHLLCPYCVKLYQQQDKRGSLPYGLAANTISMARLMSNSSYRLTTTFSNSVLPEKDCWSFMLLVTALRLEKTFNGLQRRWGLNFCINLQNQVLQK